ncbi:hypothetical protein QLQ15_08620 [Lysobacter sp. LF1]|uniref:DUF4149 domain-containing protein n=1 Tax=Lysobacter stagni TaxID=3045172 RepID=A0ABT6XFQ2_9GAMM|nr:hypothetical protein [Lysobacter sp. LF1]MDI9238978.1 hypothetical protein [Lysobacter sp. LF1]
MTPPAPARRASWFSWLLLLLGACGFAAVWVLASLYTGRQLGWMAVIGALDIAWLLRLGGWRPGLGRLVAGVLATAAIVVVANWFITATQLGAMMGLDPWNSALRLGPHHAWILVQLANSTVDIACIALGLIVAAWLSR